MLSETFEVEIGTRQGCYLSPSLFNIFLNDLPSQLELSNCDPVLLKDRFLSCLMYADDLVMLSTSSKGLQNCLNVF